MLGRLVGFAAPRLPGLELFLSNNKPSPDQGCCELKIQKQNFFFFFSGLILFKRVKSEHELILSRSSIPGPYKLEFPREERSGKSGERSEFDQNCRENQKQWRSGLWSGGLKVNTTTCQSYHGNLFWKSRPWEWDKVDHSHRTRSSGYRFTTQIRPRTFTWNQTFSHRLLWSFLWIFLDKVLC